MADLQTKLDECQKNEHKKLTGEQFVKVISELSPSYEKALFEFAELSYDKKCKGLPNYLGATHSAEEIIERKCA